MRNLRRHLLLRRGVAACIAWASLAVAAATPAPQSPLSFQVREGRMFDYFLRAGPIAGNVVLRGGPDPRILIAFPAGDSGVGLWFAPQAGNGMWALVGRPKGIRTHDEKGRVLYGISLTAVVADPKLAIHRAVLSSVRVLRDYQSLGTIPPGIATSPVEKGQTLTWSRDRLDGAAGYRLTVEVVDGRLRGRQIVAGHDGKIGLRITGLTGEAPLVPLSGRDLLLHPSAGNVATRNTLTFLAYREKLLAGSWRFDTYFGRDTLLSVRLLMPVLSPTAIEVGLNSVLARLSPQGEVAHEEDIGEQAVLDHIRADGSRSAAPVYDYKMIDEDYLLAPVAADWLLEPGEHARSAAFLAGQVGGPLDRHETRGAALLQNLRFVLHSAAAFARQPEVTHLIGLKPGMTVGDWRDGVGGLGGGRYPYDVEAVLVPAALDALARLQASGLLAPYTTASDRTQLADAAQMARVWRTKAPPLFDVIVSHAAAVHDIETYAASQGVAAKPALEALGPHDLYFHALSLMANGAPVPVMNSDEGFLLLFGKPSAQDLERIIPALMRPFPAGLMMTDVGMVVANPAYCLPRMQPVFSRHTYQGTVVWSWQQALFAAGLSRQLERKDLPAAARADLLRAQHVLWPTIEATRAMQNFELWSWSYEAGRYRLRPFGSSAADVDESDAAQLWSTVYLAVREDRPKPPNSRPQGHTSAVLPPNPIQRHPARGAD